MTKNELNLQLAASVDSFANAFASFPDEKLFHKPDEKWSIAEQLQHLILAVKPLILAYSLPGFILQILFGKSNRPSRSYEELLAKYNSKLAEGGKASAPYIPKPIRTGSNKTKLIENFTAIHKKFLRKSARWPESKLDQYVLPHPLLGKITLREMLFFTDFHIRHHEKTIKN